MNRIKAKGAVLIMTMMAICLSFMMMYVLVQTTGIGLYNAASFYDREAALQAAQSGLDYAVTRLQSNYGWRGDSNCKYWNGTSEYPYKTYGSLAKGILVGESNGNVVGIFRTNSNSISAFRIKFSFEDNSLATYEKVTRNRFGLPGTSSYMPKYEIKSPYVSVNNLLGSLPAAIYRSTDTGKGVDLDPAKVEIATEPAENAAVVCHVQPQRVYLVVEGMSGKALRDCKSLDDANRIANSGNGLIKRYIETFYSSNAQINDDSAAFAAGNLSFHVNDKVFASTYLRKLTSDVSQLNDPCNVPVAGSLRSNSGTISVDGGVLNTFNGKLVHSEGHASVYKPDTTTYKFINPEGKEQEYQFLHTADEIVNSPVDKIAWDNVAKASSSGDNITAGFYQWRRVPGSTEKDPRYYLRYYPDGYVLDDKDRPMPKNSGNFQIAVAGKPQNFGDNVIIDGKSVSKMSLGPADKIKFMVDESGAITEPTFSILGNLYCNGNFTVGSAVDEVKPCPRFQIFPKDSASGTKENGVLTADGNIYIASSLYGSGAVVTKNDVTFMGGSIVESGNCGVAIYGNNVTLKSLEGVVASSPSGQLLDYDLLQGSPPLDNLPLDFGPDGWGPELISKLDALWCESAPAPPDIDSIRIMLVSFFKEQLNVNIGFDKQSFEFYKSTCLDELKFNFDIRIKSLESGSTIDTYHFYCNTKSGTCEVSQGGTPVTAIIVPKEAIYQNAGGLDTSALNLVQQQHVKMFGTMCYGDQVFSGVVYAKNNFVTDLGSKFNLTVTGAVRAEKGSIDITCKSANVAYDESYLRLLLPTYSRLNCKLWNCW